jgi:hypothetical protein
MFSGELQGMHLHQQTHLQTFVSHQRSKSTSLLYHIPQSAMMRLVRPYAAIKTAAIVASFVLVRGLERSVFTSDIARHL